MKFTVKTINSSRYEFEVGEDETVEQLKLKLQEKTNIASARQKLIFLGTTLHALLFTTLHLLKLAVKI